MQAIRSTTKSVTQRNQRLSSRSQVISLYELFYQEVIDDITTELSAGQIITIEKFMITCTNYPLFWNQKIKQDL